jgi:two-component system chemotaxis response regulator CheY
MSPAVLIVDDSALIRAQVRRCLSPEFSVFEAADGVEGLAKLESMPDITLVLCDVNMPNMGGIELLENMRAREALAHVPFVFLTTEAQPALVEKGRSLSAKGWMLKPFKPELVLATARKIAAASAA